MGNRVTLGSILYGVISIIVILLLISVVLSILLHFTSIREASVQWFLLPITLLSLFIGGAIAGYRSGEKGWYVGGVTGGVFLILIWLISFLGFNSPLSLKNTLMFAAYLIIAVMGGMIGVNMSPRRS